MYRKKTRSNCAKIRSKRRIVGIRSDHVYSTTNLLVLLLTTATATATTVFLLVIGIVREALVAAVKQWTPLLFSCRILLLKNDVANGYGEQEQEQECFRPRFWSHRYRANLTVAAN